MEAGYVKGFQYNAPHQKVFVNLCATLNSNISQSLSAGKKGVETYFS